jgi:DNA-binding transcriptional LysR family regulator
MELSHLRYLQAVARAGSLTAAAATLGVSQPALTIAMHKLEQDLGTTLLLRNRSGVVLTATGEELVHYANEVLILVERTKQLVQGIEREQVGSFVLGCPETLGAYTLPSFLRAFMRDSPRITLSLWNGPSRAVEKAVVDRTVHFGLVVNPLPHPDLVLVELFHDATDLFIAAEEGKLGLKQAQARLRQGPLVYVARLPQPEELLRQLARLKLVPEQRLVCGTLELVKSLALSGVGVSIIPRRVAAYAHEGKLIRLHPKLPFVPDTIYLTYRSDLHRTASALRLKDALVAHGRKMRRA